MQKLFTTGRIGKDAELRTTQSGQQVCGFSLASDQGFGDKKTTNWFRVSLWGKRGQSLAPYLLKGGQVAVSGELEIGEWEGKPQFNINADDIDLMGGRSKQDNSHPNQDFTGGAGNPAFDDGLNDSVPFATNDYRYEHKRRQVL
jgi:single-strand DNA-binding protein